MMKPVKPARVMVSESTGDFLTTREVATLLRIKERKVYDLVARQQIPCVKATGKLLFQRNAIEAWLASSQLGPQTHTDIANAPDVLLGSHDPLLEWAITASGSNIASQFGGSAAGLDRFAEGAGSATGLHIFASDSGTWNVSEVARRFSGEHVALIGFCWRERGLILRKESASNVGSLKDLIDKRLVERQRGTGSQILLEALMRNDRLSAADLTFSTLAHTETEAASCVFEGLADAALGLQALAEKYQLAFIPLIRERFDLLVNRRSWFEPPLQKFAQFCRGSEFRKRALSLPGYDASAYGEVHFNG